ncbi:hypothetical protein FQN54_005190 [Arachnomyces sp. PD_36]|nr:hypothetical protein FQN54_005190 [Arachnomyces sp. PD_36]
MFRDREWLSGDEDEMPQLTTLPDELLLDIAEQLTLEEDINALSTTNRRLHCLLINYLYRFNVRQSESSALVWAARRGVVTTARRSIEQGADVEVKSDGLTPLSLAAAAGHDGVVELLIATGRVDPEFKDPGECKTPLWWAANNGHDRVVKLLLGDIRVEPDSRDDDSWGTPLARAAYNGHEEVVRLLLETGKVDPDSKDNNDRTPLWWAASEGHKEVALLLLATDRVNIESKNVLGFTPLYLAASEKRVELVRLLLEKGAQISRMGRGGWSPLHVASSTGDSDSVRLLLQNGAQVTEKTNRESTPLSIASSNGHFDVVQLLLANDSSIEEQNDECQTPLHEALCGNHLSVVQLLLDHGASIESPGIARRWTPVHHAAYHGWTELVQLLLERGARVDSLDVDKCSVLHEASNYGHVETMRLLLEKGATIDEIPCESTALSHTLCSAKTEAVQLLLSHGAMASSEDFRAISQMAAWIGGLTGLALIQPLERQSHVNPNSGYYADALNIACFKGHTHVVDYILKAGTDLEKSDEHGWSPWHFASLSWQKVGIEKVLSRFGSRPSTLCTPLPPTAWSVTEKPPCLVVAEDGITVAYRGMGKPENPSCFSVRANRPIPLQHESFYFEVKILNAGDDGSVGVGLSHDYTSLDGMPGWGVSSWGYHGDDGKFYAQTVDDGEDYRSPFGTDDIIGCDFNIDKGEISFTYNGHPLGVASSGVYGKLYPTIGLGCYGASVQVNFGHELFRRDTVL